MIAVTATLKIKAGKEAEFEGVMRELGEKVRANESGCKLYQLARSKKDPTIYVVIERYDDQEAFTVHSGTDYFKSAVPKMSTCFDGPPAIEIFEEIT